MVLLIPKKWVHECVWSRREVATGNYSGNFNAEEDDRERRLVQSKAVRSEALERPRMQ
jgi:hypothetical protein